MHRRSMTRLVALIAAVTILVLVGAPTVLGKEGVSVNLVAPLPGDAQPGAIVPAVFTMEAISDDVASPLTRAKVFIRLYGPSGAVTEAAGVEQKTPGLYTAMIEIPAGGVARCEFGVHGKAMTASGTVVATDPVWAYDGVLLTAAMPLPVDPTGISEPAAATLSLDPRLALAAGLGLVAIVAGAILGRRRRMHGRTAA
jgi:hypothetical protein